MANFNKILKLNFGNYLVSCLPRYINTVLFAFNDLTVNNDDTKMRYVDIDRDTETFSSSQATLTLPEDFKKIAYAGLYWSATYAYEKGTRKEQKGNYDYRGSGERSAVINQIKFI